MIRNPRHFIAGSGVVGQAVGSILEARLGEKLNKRVVGITDREWRPAVLRDIIWIGRSVPSGEGIGAVMVGFGEGKERWSCLLS